MLKIIIPLLIVLIFIASVNGEILNERQEQTCNKNKCSLTSYSSDLFVNYNGWKTHKDLLQTTDRKINEDLEYSYKDNTIITYKPFVIINGKEISLDQIGNEEASIVLTPINYYAEIINKRHESKFIVEIDKTRGLTDIGFYIITNQHIEYLDFEYYPENQINLISNDLYSINTTDLIIGNKRIAFYDLAENGFKYSFDKKKNKLLIDVSDKIGRISIDPSEQFVSTASDGNINYNYMPLSCVNALSTAVISDMGQDDTINLYLWGFMDFNTTINNITPIEITSQKLQLRHSIKQTTRFYTPPNWNVDYHTRQNKLNDTLSCSTDSSLLGFTGQGSLDWTTSSTFYNKTLPNIDTNLTGFTTVRITNGWDLTGLNKMAKVRWVTSENAFPNNRPKYFIEYDLIIPNDPPIVNLTIPENNYFTNNSLITFSCNVTDVDGNLNNISLLINDEINLTESITGSYNSSNFTVSFPYGSYNWNCLSFDTNGENDTNDLNYIFNVFETPEEIEGIEVGVCPSSTNLVLIYILLILIALFFAYIGINYKLFFMSIFSSLMFFIIAWTLHGCSSLLAYVLAFIAVILLLISILSI